MVCAVALSAQTPFVPLSEVRPGMRGTGRTVFSGDKVEEFQAEILGVLENAGPKQSIILARLSGGPLAQAGVLQGMSGSPVYINGRLLGAVAMAFPFSTEPVAGIRPIEEMLRPGGRLMRAQRLEELARAREDLATGPARMTDIATPLTLAGFTRRTVEQFAPQLRSLGLEPVQGILGGGRPGPAMGDPRRLPPGSMISVGLMTGDLSVGAEGTLTHVDGKRVYAFGHRFLSIGETELPFARAEVLTLVPNLSTSFKISSAREWMGAITSDRSTAVTGELGRRASLVPVSVDLETGPKYRLEVARDRLLTPFLVQMATYAVIDATERVSGAATVSVNGRLEFESGPPIPIRNIYSADTAASLGASLAAAVPLNYATQTGLPEFRVKSVSMTIGVREEKRQVQLDGLWVSRATARPGESIDIHVALTGPGGAEVRKKAVWRVPLGAALGPVQITAADAVTTNVAEFGTTVLQPPSTAAQVRTLLGGLRANDTLTVRVLRSEPGFVVQGQTLNSPPPSLVLLLRRSPGSAIPNAATKLAEFDLPVDGYVVSGSKTIQVEVKE